MYTNGKAISKTERESTEKLENTRGISGKYSMKKISFLNIKKVNAFNARPIAIVVTMKNHPRINFSALIFVKTINREIAKMNDKKTEKMEFVFSRPIGGLKLNGSCR